MKRGRLIVSLAVLFLCIVVLFLVLNYNNTKASENIGPMDEDSTALYSLYKVEPNDFNAGQTLEFLEGDVASISIKNEDYSFKVLSLNAAENRADLVVNNFLFFYLNGNEEKKLDVNSDDYYDILVKMESMTDGKAKIMFKAINERRGIIEIVDSRIDGVLEKLEKNYKIQSSLIVLILFVLLVLLVLYIIKFHLIPSMQISKMTKKHKNSEVIDLLIIEFNESKNKKEKEKARRILFRIKHLLEYMSEEEKGKYESKIKNMERYIN
jgi:hypothetical protein